MTGNWFNICPSEWQFLIVVVVVVFPISHPTTTQLPINIAVNHSTVALHRIALKLQTIRIAPIPNEIGAGKTFPCPRNVDFLRGQNPTHTHTYTHSHTLTKMAENVGKKPA